jgi:hypothetical protein
LPTIEIKHLIQSFHAVLLKGYFLAQWKVAETVLILKPGKTNKLTSYLPTNLLPTISKGFEKPFFKKAPPNV